jgi:hypothetical protein
MPKLRHRGGEIPVGFESEREALAYCAGIIDGEGCVYIRRTARSSHPKATDSLTYQVELVAKMTDPAPLVVLHDVLGGSKFRGRPQERRRALYPPRSLRPCEG